MVAVGFLLFLVLLLVLETYFYWLSVVVGLSMIPVYLTVRFKILPKFENLNEFNVVTPQGKTQLETSGVYEPPMITSIQDKDLGLARRVRAGTHEQLEKPDDEEIFHRNISDIPSSYLSERFNSCIASVLFSVVFTMTTGIWIASHVYLKDVPRIWVKNQGNQTMELIPNFVLLSPISLLVAFLSFTIFSYNLTISPTVKLIVSGTCSLIFFVTEIAFSSSCEGISSLCWLLKTNSFSCLTLSILALIFFIFSREKDRTNRLHHQIIYLSYLDSCETIKKVESARNSLYDFLPGDLDQIFKKR